MFSSARTYQQYIYFHALFPVKKAIVAAIEPWWIKCLIPRPLATIGKRREKHLSGFNHQSGIATGSGGIDAGVALVAE